MSPSVTVGTRGERRIVTTYYRSIDHAIDTFRTYFGPMARAFQAIHEAGQEGAAQ